MVRWKGYGPEHEKWVKHSDIFAKDTINASTAVEGSDGRRVEIYLHVGFDFTLPCPYFMLQHLFV
jgi:hypothetical protein